MMSEPAAPEIAQAPRTKRGSTVLRVVIGALVVVAVVWYLRSRHQDRSPSSNDAAATARGGSGAPRDAAGRDEEGGPEGRVVTVQVATAERKDLPIWLEGLGTVAAFQQVTVRPQVDGRIDKVLFAEGQPVKKGDVLVQLDPRPCLFALRQGALGLAVVHA